MSNCRFEEQSLFLNASISSFKPPSLRKKQGGTMSSHLKENKSKKKALNKNSTKPAKSIKKIDIAPVLEFGSVFKNNTVILTLPLRTVSEANCFEPWQKKYKRHKAQKKAIFFAMLEHKHLIRLPCKITYIRYAKKFLDKHDNLPISMKYLNDQLCAEITGDHRPGKADDSDQIEIKYDQVKSKVYGVKIIIEF